MESKQESLKIASPRKTWRVIGIAVLVVAVGLGIWYARNQNAQRVVSGVVSSPADVLQNQAGRTNVLLLGIGGAGHSGGDLTDSMLFISLGLDGQTAKMIPIPRDIWVDSLAAKINTAYHYGNESGEGEGRNLAKQAVAEVLGVPVHYVLVLDFQGFVKAIDAVGGIDVEVQNTFDDYKYPIPGKETAQPESARYEHIHFDQGLTHMDGETALKFARSRHAVGDEGTDFARAARQEKIILAFRHKALSTQTLFSPSAIDALKNSIMSSIDTDIDSREQASFFKVFLGLGSLDNVETLSLTDFLQNPKITKNYGGQWVLIPSPSVESIRTYVQTELAR